MKRILNITIWLAFIAGMIVLAGFIDAEHKKITCKQMDVLIDYQDGDPLIYADEVKDFLIRKFDTLVGIRLQEISAPEMEILLKTLPPVENAEVYTTLTGSLKIKLTQRTPLLRLINQKNESYYVDKFGKLFQVKPGSSSRVVVVNGYIEENLSDTSKISTNSDITVIGEALKMANYIRENDFLNAQIEQIYITKNKEFELIPKVGRQIIIFGDTKNMEKKFDKLIAFYEKGIAKKGWDQYKSINLKFENQVVCSKN
jgi:cell division protein FtsQ